MENLSSLVGQFFGGATAQQASAAASTHVQEADPNEVADHLSQSVNTMDQPSTANLGQELLAAFTAHTGDASTATNAAGVSPAAVASGEPGAVGALLQYAKQNPQVIQAAASAFMQRNPAALTSLAPGLIQGIMSRL